MWETFFFLEVRCQLTCLVVFTRIAAAAAAVSGSMLCSIRWSQWNHWNVLVLLQVLCNGPGTCIPVCVAAFLLTVSCLVSHLESKKRMRTDMIGERSTQFFSTSHHVSRMCPKFTCFTFIGKSLFLENAEGPMNIQKGRENQLLKRVFGLLSNIASQPRTLFPGDRLQEDQYCVCGEFLSRGNPVHVGKDPLPLRWPVRSAVGTTESEVPEVHFSGQSRVESVTLFLTWSFQVDLKV